MAKDGCWAGTRLPGRRFLSHTALQRQAAFLHSHICVLTVHIVIPIHSYHPLLPPVPGLSLPGLPVEARKPASKVYPSASKNLTKHSAVAQSPLGPKSPTATAPTPLPKPKLTTEQGYQPRDRKSQRKTPPQAPVAAAKSSTLTEFVKLLEAHFRCTLNNHTRIGEGSSSTVYRVIADDSFYALKIPKVKGIGEMKHEYENACRLPYHENLMQYVQMFTLSELRSAFAQQQNGMDIDFVPHPMSESPTIYSPHHHHGPVAILQELALGGTLNNRFDHSPLPESEFKPFLRDILQALNALHSSGFMHLDVKPENVFMTVPASEGFGPCRLGDFGRLVHYTEFKADQSGDNRYMAPELYNDTTISPDLLHAPDIFSLGVLCLEATTNLYIPKGGEPTYTMLRTNRPPLNFMTELSSELTTLICRMLDKSPGERPTAYDLLQDSYFSDVPSSFVLRTHHLSVTEAHNTLPIFQIPQTPSSSGLPTSCFHQPSSASSATMLTPLLPYSIPITPASTAAAQFAPHPNSRFRQESPTCRRLFTDSAIPDAPIFQ